MGELVNLRQRRKQRARAEKEQRAAENRILHGRSKAERMRDESDRSKTIAQLDGHRLTGRPERDPK
ncbi:DUF4169 family protein [Nitratireductor sp. OM-1]|uniref:DUF4169 family protein n=1 Tax=Nitratireductor sp. OM-1 TaxID=1756988 RepID=UPI000DDEC059|nr:DUF4169 family protein [Nitratireductor sp. OM-1]